MQLASATSWPLMRLITTPKKDRGMHVLIYSKNTCNLMFPINLKIIQYSFHTLCQYQSSNHENPVFIVGGTHIKDVKVFGTHH